MADKTTLEQWQQLFRETDKDNNGYLTVGELRTLMKKGNSKITDSQIAESFIRLDGVKGDRHITLDEFIRGLQEIMEQSRKLCALFKQNDADNSGFLDRAELKKLLQSFQGHKFTEAEIDDILKKADASGDGKISLKEFENACG